MRVKQMRVNADWWVRLHQRAGLAARRVVPVTLLPDDAEVIRMGHSDTGDLVLILRSKEFPDVAENAPIPFVDPPTLNVVFDPAP